MTLNEYIIKDSFSIAKEIQEFDPSLVMVSFDAKQLFTSIALKGTWAFVSRISIETKYILQSIIKFFRQVIRNDNV